MKGKTALITGSTTGIGLAIAGAMAARGARIMLNGFGDADDIEAQRARLAQEHSVEVLYDGADLTDPEQIAALMARMDSLGGTDILINNAGIQHVSPIESFTLERWQKVIDLNLTAVYLTMHHALPRMRRKNWGRIVNMASAHGLVASASKSAYVAAKHAVVGLSKVVALETARTGITCNTVCPGWVLTPLVQAQIDTRAEENNQSVQAASAALLAEKQPSGEFVTPGQVAQSVCFLCSDAAAQIRGSSLSIDGGWTAQ